MDGTPSGSSAINMDLPFNDAFGLDARSSLPSEPWNVCPRPFGGGTVTYTAIARNSASSPRKGGQRHPESTTTSAMHGRRARRPLWATGGR